MDLFTRENSTSLQQGEVRKSKPRAEWPNTNSFDSPITKTLQHRAQASSSSSPEWHQWLVQERSPTRLMHQIAVRMNMRRLIQVVDENKIKRHGSKTKEQLIDDLTSDRQFQAFQSAGDFVWFHPYRKQDINQAVTRLIRQGRTKIDSSGRESFWREGSRVIHLNYLLALAYFEPADVS